MELEQQQKFWRNRSRLKDENSLENANGPKVTMQRTAIVRTPNRNANNSNNKQPVEDSVQPGTARKSESTDDFGEIHPEMTPEGYGLRTPYGTHFNLDFLKYCQNIADSPRTPRSSSGSQRSSLTGSDPRPEQVCGNDKHPSPTDTRCDVERNLWETRRRLDAFRSFRKKAPTVTEQQQYSSRFTNSNVTNGQRDKTLETDPSASPVLTNLMNASFQQQNLQSVREQMAAALARLKFLENEVKEIQVLQVKISVLQQEKQKLSNELKMCKESSQGKGLTRKDSNSTQSSTSPPSHSASPSPRSSKASIPPPPPRRKYRSLAVGPDSPEELLSQVGTRKAPQNEVFLKPTRVLGRSEMKTVSCDPSPDIEYKDACVGISKTTSAKYTSMEQIELRSTSTSSSDLVKTASASCGEHAETIDTESQYTTLQLVDSDVQVLRSDFTKDSSNQVQPESKDQAVLTENDFVILNPKEHKDACVGNSVAFQFVPMKRSVSTSTPHLDVQDQAENTEKPLLCDKTFTCKPEVADFECSVHIRPEVASACTETEMVTTVDSYTLTDHKVLDFTNQTTNTEVIQTMEKSSFYHPETSEFSCNVRLQHGVSVSTCTEKATFKDADCNTQVISCQNFAVQVMPAMSDFSHIARILPPQNDVAVTANIKLEIPKIPSYEISSQTDLDTLKNWFENVVREKKSVCDAFTEMSVVVQSASVQNMQSEIGAYVGQVETLLEEQQSLLAENYKELGDVMDEPGVQQPAARGEKFRDMSALPPELIKDLDVFTKDKYALPSELKTACDTVAKGQNTDMDSISVNDALQLLKQEWFLISALQDTRPDYIKDFASEVRVISPYALTKVVNSLDETGNSALHYAVSHEDFGLICTLVDIPELDVDQHNQAGYTASMLAAITRIQTDFEVQAMAALFQRADVSLHAKQASQTALMLAVSHGCTPAAKLLLKAGADVNSQDEDGSTALMCATEHGHVELVKLLLAHPICDPTITDNDGSAAINIAMDSGQRDIGVLLYVHRRFDKAQEY